MYVLIFLLILLVKPHTVFGREICPLSSIMDLNNSLSYIYPLDLYAPQEFRESVKESDTFPCYGQTNTVFRAKHVCSSVTRFCPIDTQNVIDATLRRPSKLSSLCHLKDKLHNASETIRVFVSGGSITAGVGCEGCVSEDPPDLQPGHEPAHQRCAWPYHFGEWMRQAHNATVLTYNFGVYGTESALQARNIYDLARSRGVSDRYTANDVFFLDHSVNDDYYLNAERGIENLILSIYSQSVNDSWPTIIVLDAAAADFHGKHPKLYWIGNKQDVHPPWHVQLFMADLYSAIWETEMTQCTTELAQLTSDLHSAPLILPPIKSEKIYGLCDVEERIVLRTSYEHVMKNTSIGTFSVIPENTWKVKEDVTGRGGFVVDKVDNPDYKGRIGFRMSNSTKQLLVANITNIIIHVTHLRTYENAGVVHVHLCGRLLHNFELDALWPDFRVSKISIPQASTIFLPIESCVHNGFEYPVVAFSHVRAEMPTEVRKEEKFKIIGITACV